MSDECQEPLAGGDLVDLQPVGAVVPGHRHARAFGAEAEARHDEFQCPRRFRLAPPHVVHGERLVEAAHGQQRWQNRFFLFALGKPLPRTERPSVALRIAPDRVAPQREGPADRVGAHAGEQADQCRHLVEGPAVAR